MLNAPLTQFSPRENVFVIVITIGMMTHGAATMLAQDVPLDLNSILKHLLVIASITQNTLSMVYAENADPMKDGMVKNVFVSLTTSKLEEFAELVILTHHTMVEIVFVIMDSMVMLIDVINVTNHVVNALVVDLTIV